ncbi:hypothetical protein WJX81_002194 [Elliptochloris bilobata]|uniref:HhH-GPD domain-containing protein n=1 Tax=Elliptochloris bilobata TaxID=381761 RepID=A0AAW1RM07_9CHLO
MRRSQPACKPTTVKREAARDALAALHGAPDVASVTQRSILDSLVRTILSQNTTDATSQRAFLALKQAFPTWEAVREAQPGAVEAAIRVGGLADIKAARIRAILDMLVAERAACCLEHLRELPDAEVKLQLTRFKGVGPKTVACIMMFGMQRYEFPVDTHVWRISKALGWVPARATREQAYQHLNARVPDAVKYDLHVLLVEHGKRCPRCAKIPGRPRKEPVGECPLVRARAPPCVEKAEPGSPEAKPGGRGKRRAM